MNICQVLGDLQGEISVEVPRLGLVRRVYSQAAQEAWGIAAEIEVRAPTDLTSCTASVLSRWAALYGTKAVPGQRHSHQYEVNL